jgi:hypothetical protein
MPEHKQGVQIVDKPRVLRRSVVMAGDVCLTARLTRFE